ncbi:MAG TPA: 5-(carboxyamino)imidazole ribonucleotide synthase [Longimicrobiales bacterium]|nr:5-(carboxyamino)imidazole ribonucleotide synthase [Longimicrobiales bacterium]
MRIGVLGGGQLGRMIALAGYPLGARFRHLGSAQDTSAREVAEHVNAAYEDTDALARFADGLDVVTYESENVPLEAAQFLAERLPVLPSVAALRVSQDRLAEKLAFAELGIPTAPYAPVNSFEELETAAPRIGYPAILKTRRMGYDGKGQFVLRRPDELPMAWERLHAQGLILEGLVPFDRELSIISVRGRKGETLFYPLVENVHADGILRVSYAPAPDAEAIQSVAEDYATRVMDALDYVGVMAIELFQAGAQLIANEMAPRVHNSGHWTIEGAETSQFENHVRAVLGYPLGDVAPIGYCAMVNIIGRIPAAEEVLKHPDAHLHLYGKGARPGRKLGHITLRGHDGPQVRKRAEDLRRQIAEPPAKHPTATSATFYED